MSATIIPFPRARVAWPPCPEDEDNIISRTLDSFAMRREMRRLGYSSEQIEKEADLLLSLSWRERKFIFDAVLPDR